MDDLNLTAPPLRSGAARPAAGEVTAEVEALRREIERLRVLASKERGVLNAILDHSPHGIIVCDADGRLVLQNRAAERIWAGSATATSVEDWGSYRAFHPDGRPYQPSDWAMAKCLATRQVVEATEIHILRFDGSPAYLLGSSAPLLSPEGELEGGISVFADVTRLRQTEAQTRSLEDDLATKVSALEAFKKRASLLQELTAALTRAETVGEAAELVVRHGPSLFGATASLAYLLDDERKGLDLVAWHGVGPDRVASFRRVPLEAKLPLTQAVKNGQPVWLPTRADVLAMSPQLERQTHEGAPLQAVVCIPLEDRRAPGGAIMGALAFSFYADPALDEVKRDFFLTVARQSGLAIERARAFEAARRANERLAREQARLAMLAEAAEALASSLDSRKALDALAARVVPTLADWCAIDELTPSGEVRRITVAHRDPQKVDLARRLHEAYPPRPEDQHGVMRVLRTGQSEWVLDIPDELLVASARSPEHLSVARSLRLASYAVVPIRARGRVLGTLSLVTEGERKLVEDDLRFAEELARRAALALENARLYEEAEAARAYLHGLFMHAPAAISIGRGREHRFALANPPFERLVGADGLIGRTLGEVAPAAGDLIGLVERAHDTGRTVTVSEVPIATDDGARFHTAVAQPTRNDLGRVDGVVTFAFDVTDQVEARRRVEALAADLARSEARMRALVDATAAIVWTATADGQVTELSPTWMAFTGQSEAEYLDGGFAEAIHPDDRGPTLRIWAEAIAAGAPYAAEYRLRRADGAWAHTLARGMPVRREDGTIAEYVGCNIDVTDLRHAEATARAHADTLTTVNEVGRIIAAELDLQKVVQAVSDAATALSGAAFGAFFHNVVDEHGGRYMLYTLSGAPRERFEHLGMPRATAVFAPTFNGDGVVRVDDITQDHRYGQSGPHFGLPKGHLPVRSYLAVPVVSRSGKVLGGLFLGHPQPGVFTERAEVLVSGLAAQAAVAMDNAHLYGDAQRLIRALEATNRELDQFAYVTSHDLRAPLRGIGSLAEWLEEDLGSALTDDARTKLALLRGRVGRMEGLIKGILDYSRAGRAVGRAEEVDLARLVAEVTEMLAPKPPAVVTTRGRLPTLRTERVALEQVLLNLIGNAVKHAGRPDVTVEVEALDRDTAWEIRVADNGPGIAPEFHERIWGIFQTLEARDKVESTGIGLAIVKKVVEGRGGRVAIDSSPGRGATFVFTWPKREDART